MNYDAQLMLGTRFSLSAVLSEELKIIQVDRLGDQIGHLTPVDLGLIGNVKDTLERLTPRIQSKTDRTYLDTCLNHYKSVLRLEPWFRKPTEAFGKDAQAAFP
jgi:pyruvate dehydrogenase (quinone)